MFMHKKDIQIEDAPLTTIPLAPITIYLKLVMSLLICSFFYSCQTSTKTKNIRSYYYPVAEFMDGKVYEYQAVNDSLAPFYWYFRTTTSKDDTIITSEYFDHNFIVQQLTNEEIVKNGVILNDFYLYETDSLTGQQKQNPVRVEVDNVFPFEVTDSTGLFLYKIFWRDYHQPNQKYRLIKNRHYMGETTYTYQGQQVPAIRFFNKELLEIEEVGFQEVAYNSVELYAEHIGLVYFRKEIEGNIVQEYELADVYDMADLEKKFRAAMDE